MFDKLVDLLISSIEFFYVWRVVDEWESGVVLRFGRYHRNADPGLVWVWPCYVERVVTQDTYQRPSRLPPQSLTTADGMSVVVTPIVTWKVANAKRVILETGGHEEALIDSVSGTLAEHVVGAKWADLTGEEFRRTITSEVAKRAKAWGVKVLNVQLADVIRARSYRLFSEQRSHPPSSD